MKRKQILVLVLAISLVITMVGCSAQGATTSKTDEKISITDSLGRTVEFENAPEKAVAIGAGALRLYSYVADTEKLVGVEEIEKTASTGRPYTIANPQFAELPTIGAGGPNNAPDPEQLLKVEPDVIFTTYAGDAAAADELQSKTGIPVVALSYGNEGIFGDTLYSSIGLIGEVMGNTKKSTAVVDYLKACETDLNKRTEGVDAATKLSTYVGGLGSKGAQGIVSTQGNYSLFNAINALNVVDETGKTGGVMIDKEQLIQWNPKVIFLDYSGLTKVKEDMAANPEYYAALEAFKSDQVYMILPYNSYTTNLDTAIADAYYMGTVLYPDKFKDVDPAKKAGEIYETLLGTNVYDQMVKDYGVYGKFPK